MVLQTIKSVPVVSQVAGLAQTSMKLYNCTSPLNATKIAIESIINDCAPPHVKYPIKCGMLAVQVFFAVSSGGSVLSVSLVLHMARQILEEE